MDQASGLIYEKYQKKKKEDAGSACFSSLLVGTGPGWTELAWFMSHSQDRYLAVSSCLYVAGWEFKTNVCDIVNPTEVPGMPLELTSFWNQLTSWSGAQEARVQVRV